ncbi:MAG: ABC transporter permease, partial [Bacteroidota bacterium]
MPQPPKYAHRFLLWFCKEDFLEEIEGDLIELFDLTYVENSKKARRNFIWGVLTHFRPDYIKSFQLNNAIIHPAMIRHNLLITYRSFLRNKSSFLINLVGLSTGLACAVMIYLWVQDERRTDAFHAKDDQLYQVMSHFDLGSHIETEEYSPTPLAEALKADFPEVEEAGTINDFFTWDNNPEGILSVEGKGVSARAIHASKQFFTLFSYPILHGSSKNVLGDKDNIAISKTLAENLFSEPNKALGQFLEWKHPGFSGTYQVAGIFEDPPSYSTDQFDVVFTMEVLYEKDRWSHDWNGDYGETILHLKQGTDIASFNNKIAKYMSDKKERPDQFTLFVQPFSKKYLYNSYRNGIQTGGRITYVRLFSLIAMIILLIACVNFMNLSTAKASLKMKEIGVKKTIGARREHLISQLLGESLILSFLSLGVALLMVYAFIPQFNQITGKVLTFQFHFGDLWILFCITILTGLVAGSYPAFYLSKIQPILILKQRLTNQSMDLWIRKGLVVFQFVLAIGFVVGLLVINRQIAFTQEKNLGYNRDNIIQFSWKGELYSGWERREMGKTNQTFYSFLEGLRNIPGVRNASCMSGDIVERLYGQGGVSWEGIPEGESHSFTSPVIGEDAIETLGVELLAGRSFSRDLNDDYNKIIVNEAFARKMGTDNPVGSLINWSGKSEI